MNQSQKKLIDNGEMLPLMEAFYTIQGEGFHKGSAAYFIRIGGCDVGCHWCDVKESWDSLLHSPTLTTQIVQDALIHSDTVVITGGEPLMWNMNFITSLLRRKNKLVHIETSGAYDLSGEWDWICLSPKKNKNPKSQIYKVANELKIIVHNKNDLLFAEEQAKKVRSSCLLYLQPEWSKKDQMMPLIVDYVMNNPKWKVSLQTHKYLNIP